jgi:monoamine oxidase
MASLGLKQRLELAMKGGEKLHPGFRKHVPIELGLSIAWKQVPYQLGGWAEDWQCDNEHYERLLKREKRFWVAGDQVSYLSGWQEGAVRSAHHVIADIAGVRVAPETMLEAAPQAPPLRRAPGIRRRTRGLP